ncbi:MULTISPECIES: nuclear transport factor 2 family protein [unclassified Ruegeria]|uniref:nuclear transport factor 2 family protein n=1 Tax=unclassified Ruegeria TaxID=2625375 RepID=UPI001487BE9E|nr:MULTISPECIES: nuclear transport factor 2 family protein [unclassified Ruegeria]
MQDLDQTILDYGAAWQELDADNRMRLLERCFEEDGRYVDPTADVKGREALSVHIGEVLKSSGGRVEITTKPSVHHYVVHFRWHMINAEGQEMVAGHDFVRLGTGGKIQHLAGFFGDPAPTD